MNRGQSIDALAAGEKWDLLVIGGGASGLGAAVDAAARGYRTALVEAHDFAKGTSSRSTKLIHGGVRYLRQGNISLVRESLRERALLLRNAPDLSRKQSFIIPAYGLTDRAFYGVGLRAYDALAGRLSLGPSQWLSRAEVLRRIPNVQSSGLRGGILYYDGQFDDARLAICLAQRLHDLGGFAANYLPVERLIKEHDRIAGALVRDAESGREFEIRARAVINATGVFTDSIRRLDDPAARELVTASQGAHVVVDRSFLRGDAALMVPKTRDGRVLFAIPWQDRVVIGTTDTPVDSASLDPHPFPKEIQFILEHSAMYLAKAPSESDVLSVFAGLRPLVKADAENTSQLSRDHSITTSKSGLVSIAGGKWTTYRKMGEDVVTRAAEVGGLDRRPPRTEQLSLLDRAGHTVARFVREEMARTVEDVLARRQRTLILDARAAIEAAPSVASEMAKELGRDQAWESAQVESFRALARKYLLSG